MNASAPHVDQVVADLRDIPLAELDSEHSESVRAMAQRVLDDADHTSQVPVATFNSHI